MPRCCILSSAAGLLHLPSPVFSIWLQQSLHCRVQQRRATAEISVLEERKWVQTDPVAELLARKYFIYPACEGQTHTLYSAKQWKYLDPLWHIPNTLHPISIFEGIYKLSLDTKVTEITEGNFLLSFSTKEVA